MFNVIASFFIFFKMASTHQPLAPGSADLHRASYKILGVVDDVFITLRISDNFKRYKSVPEYLSMHNYIRDAVENRNEKYKELYSLSKVTPSDKADYYVAVINKVIGEMISEHRATTDLYFTKELTETVPIPSDDVMTDFVNMAKKLRLNLTYSIIPLKDTEIARIPETRRIFAGVKTELREWPFIVSIHISGRFVCAGSIIREDLILSAALCFKRFYRTKLLKKFKSNIWIRAGSHFCNSGGVTVRAVALHFHPRFDAEERINNIVVIQLRLKLVLKHRRVQPVKYARVKTKYKDVDTAGWGNEEYESRSVPESPEIVRMTELPENMDSNNRKDGRRNFGGSEGNLQYGDRRLLQATLDSYSLIDCRSFYENYTITGKNFCAGSRRTGSGACKFDMGGPGMIGARLEGVISFGPPRCGFSKAPTVFTKVYRYASWIDKIICKIPLTNETVEDSGQMGALEEMGPQGKKFRKYTYVAAIFVKKKFVCTGAILRRELVITLASCLLPFDFLNEGVRTRKKFTFNTNIEVRVGSDLYSSGKMYPVINFHFHHYFKRETVNFNLVILVLKNKMEFIKGEVGGIHISRHRVLKSTHKKLKVVGWGTHCPASRNGVRNVPPELLRAELLNKTWFRLCRKNFTGNRQTSYFLTRLHSCLETAGWGADSPGNLAILKNKLYGLLSLDCSRRTADSPSVVIKVGVFSWWINRIMCQYKEPVDPSDLSKESDYGAVANTSSEENIIIKGLTIRCWDPDRKKERLNCTSINATTYYCERPVYWADGGRPVLDRWTDIQCANLDKWTGVKCVPGNASYMDRDDISRSVIHWPHGSNHTGNLFTCVPYSKNFTNLTCSGTGKWTWCDEHNCTFAERDRVYQCQHRDCYVNWLGYVICTIQWRYCKDLRLRLVKCPTSTRTCWRNWTHNIAYCQFNDCRQRWLNGDPEQLIEECHRQHTCYSFPDYVGVSCREAHVRDCTRIENNWKLNYNNAYVCQKRNCLLNVTRNMLMCSSPGPVHCIDHNANSLTCPVYTVTNCTPIDNYFYKEAFVCWYKKCTITRAFGIFHSCEKENVECHVISRGVRKNIKCPEPGRNCRTVTVYSYDPYEITTRRPEVYTEHPKVLPDLPGELTVNSDDWTEENTEPTTIPTTIAPYDVFYCADASVCYYSNYSLVYCTINHLYCLQNGTDNGTFVEVPCPGYVKNDRARIDDDDGGYYGDVEGNNDDKDDDSHLTTYASPRQIVTDVPIMRANTDDDDYNVYPDIDYDSQLTTYASPILRAPTDGDNGNDDSDNDDDSQATTYASPSKIQTDVQILRAHTDDDDVNDDSDNDDDSQATTYASPRQIQTDVPILRAHTDDNYDSDNDDDSQVTTYASPRQIESDVSILRVRTDNDDNNDDSNTDDDSQETTYASPRQIQTDAPILRINTNDDDDYDGAYNDDDSQATTYASLREIEPDASTLRAHTGDDDYNDDALLDVYKENNAIDYTFEIGNENSSQVYISW